MRRTSRFLTGAVLITAVHCYGQLMSFGMSKSGTSPPRILIADDQPDVLKALRLLLKPEGYRVVEVMTPAGIVAELDAREFDVLLMDLNNTRDTTSGREGLELLPRVQELDGALPIVVNQ